MLLEIIISIPLSPLPLSTFLGDSVEPISFIVPRKSEAFQEDIFPDTNAGVPSLSAGECYAVSCCLCDTQACPSG